MLQDIVPKVKGSSIMDGIRINKYLADAGICSRREADKLIEAGRVTVDGRVAEPGGRVLPGQKVLVGKKAVKPVDEKVVLAYYKPVGVTCTEKDVHAALKVTDEINYKTRVTYAGRLDKASEGLLLMTNDGNLINRMMRGSEGHEKEYHVKIDREITSDFIETMAGGIYLEEIGRFTKPCKVESCGKFRFRIILTE